MNEELTNENIIEEKDDDKVEALAEALAEVVDEKPAEESEVEKTNAQETELEETETEETEAEETEAKETETEESETEETETEEPKKSRKTLMIVIISVVAALVLLGGIYFGMTKKYSECFLEGTFVNGIECSGMTIDQVGNLLQKQVEEYVLTIEGANGTTEEIKGTEIDIVYKGYKQLKESFEKQNPYAWPKAFFKTNDITVEVDLEYDAAKLEERIATLECLKPENQIAAVAATVIYQDGQFVIQNESYGTQIDTEKFNEVIVSLITSVGTRLNLEEAGCYLQPRFTKDSAEVIAARDEMNKYLTATITYSLDNVVVTVDKSITYEWISVDENMSPVISSDGAKAFAKTLGNQYNTADRGGQITTPTGKVANVALAGYGRAVGVDEETNQLIAEIKEGKTVTREPIFSRSATPEGQTIWGTTYIEVDISAQHMWYIVNGQIALETDVVTGKKGSNDTPTGTYTILEMQRNRVLRGRPLANGKPSYLTPVSYWMRVTWSGIGFHDANWQPTFGGERYITNGSHGCINMPPAKAAELYGMISKGTPVIIHY